MAIVKDNPALRGLRGMIGKSLVFRQVRGKTVVQTAPVRIAPYNEAQKKQQGRFKEAIAYARSQMKHPKLKARYTAQAKAKGGTTNSFNMAIVEYFRMLKLKALLAIKMNQSGIEQLNKSFKLVKDMKNYRIDNVCRLAIDLCYWPP